MRGVALRQQEPATDPVGEILERLESASYIADASIMPTIPRANTNLPALMVAERIVEWLA